ncbi:hypothetical protein E4U54_004036 [Claviceps lovelessii]|nr:hypothetical protein E4U54_004036 [Claviceps lovelessii]
MPIAPVKDIDHLVLTCAHIPTTIRWYETHLGMQSQTFPTTSPSPSGCGSGSGSGSGSGPPMPTTRHALLFGTHKINLHQQGREFEPKARTALPGTADVCFLLDDGVDMAGVRAGLAEAGVEVLGGLVKRTGARGELSSLYVRDPDGNLIDIHDASVDTGPNRPMRKA